MQNERIFIARATDDGLRAIVELTANRTATLRAAAKTIKGAALANRLMRIGRALTAARSRALRGVLSQFEAPRDRIRMLGGSMTMLAAVDSDILAGDALIEHAVVLAEKQFRLAARPEPADAGMNEYMEGRYAVYASDPLLPDRSIYLADVVMFGRGQIEGTLRLDPLRVRFSAAREGSLFSLLGELEQVGAGRWLLGEGRGPIAGTGPGTMRASMLLSRVALAAIDDALGYVPGAGSTPEDSPAHAWAESCTLTFVAKR